MMGGPKAAHYSRTFLVLTSLVTRRDNLSQASHFGAPEIIMTVPWRIDMRQLVQTNRLVLKVTRHLKAHPTKVLIASVVMSMSGWTRGSQIEPTYSTFDTSTNVDAFHTGHVGRYGFSTSLFTSEDSMFTNIDNPVAYL